ncbi:DNA/RNA helicase domain-containing protein [Mangrovimonas sp. TPBH4]|uniref:DNA/RNA helicase domain-containing protein n=1 Tax=Mangrovimonas sp. TPBH4 TaxID=1645914 RepID=UPI0006B5227F|nr:DNA/RNA helicase domain-containing protein [Mangrovimonas sp. TPBH4]
MLRVTAGIIELDNKKLIVRRKEGKHLAGFWEFPGGKIEEGETPEACLKRELFEELGIEVSVEEFFMDNIHSYGEKTILLKSYRCKIISGDIGLKDHDKMGWLDPSEINNYKFAPADIPFVTALVNSTTFINTTYSLKSFLEVEVSVWGERLKKHILTCTGEQASYSQRKAWFDCFNILKEELSLLPQKTDPEQAKIIFEYELPRERGRRPDVLILSGNNLLILEFKGYSNENTAQIDQVKHYARDLKNYHQKSHELTIKPILVLAAAKQINKVVDGVNIVSGDLLHEVLRLHIACNFNNIREWYHCEYAPLPNLIQSAQLIFKENKFPQIKKASSAGIPETLQTLKNISIKSKENNSHHLVLISGVPGAGKTLVGIQFVYQSHNQTTQQTAVLLSGNGPLVDVLQYSLQNKNFIQSVHGFLKEYAHSTKTPSEEIFIYDEAQRAWDSEKVKQSRRTGSNSEPTDFVSIASKKDHCIIVGLIGDGQEIYLGEESGLELWAEAINNSEKQWYVHCPTKYSSYFETSALVLDDTFNLTTSLRTHQALVLQHWVETLLENDLIGLPNATKKLIEEDYPIYITRNLESSKTYLTQKYIGEEDKTYGILASSKSSILPRYGIKNDFNSTKSIHPAQYFANKSSTSYCKNLNACVTEFACQGLELDMPIVAWDKDFIYDEKWLDKLPNHKAKNSFELRKNSYRVLLTRGRDGMIIYVPEDTGLDTTYAFLKNNGCKILK